jgi:hypothetical protein
MDDSTQGREEGPLPIDIDAPIPAHPRPGTRTIVATTAEYGRWRLSRVDLDLDVAIEEEVQDYHRGLTGTYKRADPTAPETIAYAANQSDVVLWEGERCLAVIRPRPGGDPEVTRFDGSEGWPIPDPSTDTERLVWAFVKDHGAEACRTALSDAFLQPKAKPPELTEAERSILYLVRDMGVDRAYDRLLLAREYGHISAAFTRLGTDAVAELRRQIEAGRTPG